MAGEEAVTVKLIQQLGARHHFSVEATEDAAAFTDANLARFDVVIWLSTTGSDARGGHYRSDFPRGKKGKMHVEV